MKSLQKQILHLQLERNNKKSITTLDDPLITSTSNGKQIYDRARNKGILKLFDAF
jgi:hypothetical protein